MLKSKHYPDFSLNPHNVKIGDWVFARGNVGKVIDIHVNNGKMLQFWVNWDSSNVLSPELANNLQKVNKPMAISDSIREVSEKIKLTLLTIDVNLQQLTFHGIFSLRKGLGVRGWVIGKIQFLFSRARINADNNLARDSHLFKRESMTFPSPNFTLFDNKR